MDCIALDVLNLHIIDTICGEDIDRLRVLVVLQWLELLVVASYVPDAARSGCRGSDWIQFLVILGTERENHLLVNVVLSQTVTFHLSDCLELILGHVEWVIRGHAQWNWAKPLLRLGLQPVPLMRAGNLEALLVLVLPLNWLVFDECTSCQTFMHTITTLVYIEIKMLSVQ